MLLLQVQILAFVLFLSTKRQYVASAQSTPVLSIEDNNWSLEEQCLSAQNSSRLSVKTATLRLLVFLPSCAELQHRRECLSHFSPSDDEQCSECARGGPGMRLALDLAAEQINNRSDILPCHNLELVHIETEPHCSRLFNSQELVGITKELFPSGRARGFASASANQTAAVVGGIGPICLRSVLKVSAITNRPEMRMILLHNSDSLLLADRNKHAHSLGILGSTDSFVTLSLSLIKRSEWTNIVLLYDSSCLYHPSIMKHLIASVEQHNVTIKHISTLSPKFYPLDKVRHSKIHIIFTFTPLEHSKRIMCLAHHLKLVYPRYQWVFINQRLNDFACGETVSVYQWGRYYNCSCQLLMNTILKGAFLINYHIMSTSIPAIRDATYPQNIDFDHFLMLYKQKVSAYNNHEPSKFNTIVSPTKWAYNMYDAVWAWAVVLDRLTMLYRDELTFEYGNKLAAELILKEFYSIDFQGMSGQIKFNSISGFVDRSANLFQVMDGNEVHTAYYNTTKVEILQHIVSIPDFIKVVQLPPLGLVCFFLIMYFTELVIAFSLHILYFLYRNNKFVKASSPKLLQAAYAGAYIHALSMLFYISFFVGELSPAVGNLLCKAVWIWFLPIGFTMMMGIITLRAWRLYRIFTHYLNPGKFISNTALMIILSFLVLADVVLAIIRTFIDQMNFQFVEINTPKTTKIDYFLVDQTCVSSQPLVWIVVYAYKFGLCSVMIVISILTHRIPNQTFSTKLLRVFSYIYSLTFAIGFSLYYFYVFLDSRSNTDFHIFSVMLFVFFSAFICLILAPPLFPVIRHKLKMFH